MFPAETLFVEQQYRVSVYFKQLPPSVEISVSAPLRKAPYTANHKKNAAAKNYGISDKINAIFNVRFSSTANRGTNLTQHPPRSKISFMNQKGISASLFSELLNFYSRPHKVTKVRLLRYFCLSRRRVILRKKLDLNWKQPIISSHNRLF